MKLAIIGGTGLDDFLEGGVPVNIEASYDSDGQHFDRSYAATSYRDGGILFVNRHKVPHRRFSHLQYTSPSRISYKTLMVGLYQNDVTHVISTSAVGSDHSPGTILIPHSLVDYTDPNTLLDNLGEEYVSMKNPFDIDLRNALLDSAQSYGLDVIEEGIYIRIISDGRFETDLEVSDLMKRFGPDIALGMTVPTEAVLARKLGMRYATVSVVTNYAEGLDPECGEITHDGNQHAFQKSLIDVNKLLNGAVEELFQV